MLTARFFLAFIVCLAFTSGIAAQVSPLDPKYQVITRKPIIDASRPVDLLITGGTIITMNGTHQIIENGAMSIRGGVIEAIGDSAEFKGLPAKRIINARGKVIIPGLINTHTHVPMSLFRGIADDLDLNEWLTKYIFPAEAKNVNEAFVRAGTRLGLAEMIRGGTTTYCDMYYFEDAIADETSKAGVRGVLGETIIDFPVADNKTNAEAMAYTERYLTKWAHDPLIVPAIVSVFPLVSTTPPPAPSVTDRDEASVKLPVN